MHQAKKAPAISDETKRKYTIRNPVRTDGEMQVSFQELCYLGEGSLEPTMENQAALLTDPRLSHPSNGLQKARIVTQLQGRYGNAYVQRVVNYIQSKRNDGIDELCEEPPTRKGFGSQRDSTVGHSGDVYEGEKGKIVSIVSDRTRLNLKKKDLSPSHQKSGKGEVPAGAKPRLPVASSSGGDAQIQFIRTGLNTGYIPVSINVRDTWETWQERTRIVNEMRLLVRERRAPGLVQRSNLRQVFEHLSRAMRCLNVSRLSTDVTYSFERMGEVVERINFYTPSYPLDRQYGVELQVQLEGRQVGNEVHYSVRVSNSSGTYVAQNVQLDVYVDPSLRPSRGDPPLRLSGNRVHAGPTIVGTNVEIRMRIVCTILQRGPASTTAEVATTSPNLSRRTQVRHELDTSRGPEIPPGREDMIRDAIAHPRLRGDSTPVRRTREGLEMYPRLNSSNDDYLGRRAAEFFFNRMRPEQFSSDIIMQRISHYRTRVITALRQSQSGDILDFIQRMLDINREISEACGYIAQQGEPSAGGEITGGHPCYRYMEDRMNNPNHFLSIYRH